MLLADRPAEDPALLASYADGNQSRRPRCTRNVAIGFGVVSVAAAAATAVVVSSFVLNHADNSGAAACSPVQQTLVQSIPKGDFEVGPVAGSIPTHEAFIRLADAATKSLDFTAMYVDLLGSDDRKVYNASEMLRFGAERGVEVFHALVRAAERHVSIRLLLGTLNCPRHCPLQSAEVQQLLAYPSVEARVWDPRRWYDGGIMHLKLWHVDRTAAYIGSANPDWKSLAQVKEIGLLLNSSSTAKASATADLGRVFDVFWQWSQLSTPNVSVKSFSDAFQAELTLPPWDVNIAPESDRSTRSAPFSITEGSPLAALTSVAAQKPLCGTTATATPPATVFVSAAPGGSSTAGRTSDESALVHTIHSARTNLSLSVMDFLPASSFGGGHGGAPVHWPTLTNAVLAVAFSKPVHVRVLVSRWNHTSALMGPAMRRLADGLAACKQVPNHKVYQPCAGTLEVRQYEVPGWQNTTGDHAVWPPFSRVNHAKYIVSDNRVNIGTSNWEWGYFYQTAGASWNTNATEVVAAAQRVFDADWESSYALPLSREAP